MKYIYELILENYARYTCLLQSPRLGKFVSNTVEASAKGVGKEALMFQSPRSGKFVSDN